MAPVEGIERRWHTLRKATKPQRLQPIYGGTVVAPSQPPDKGVVQGKTAAGEPERPRPLPKSPKKGPEASSLMTASPPRVEESPVPLSSPHCTVASLPRPRRPSPPTGSCPNFRTGRPWGGSYRRHVATSVGCPPQVPPSMGAIAVFQRSRNVEDTAALPLFPWSEHAGGKRGPASQLVPPLLQAATQGGKAGGSALKATEPTSARSRDSGDSQGELAGGVAAGGAESPPAAQQESPMGKQSLCGAPLPAGVCRTCGKKQTQDTQHPLHSLVHCTPPNDPEANSGATREFGMEAGESSTPTNVPLALQPHHSLAGGVRRSMSMQEGARTESTCSKESQFRRGNLVVTPMAGADQDPRKTLRPNRQRRTLSSPIPCYLVEPEPRCPSNQRGTIPSPSPCHLVVESEPRAPSKQRGTIPSQTPSHLVVESEPRAPSKQRSTIPSPTPSHLVVDSERRASSKQDLGSRRCSPHPANRLRTSYLEHQRLMVESRNETSWRSAFNRVSESGQLPREYIAWALQLCGFAYIRPEVAEEAYKDVSLADSLSIEEFLSFVRAFIALNRQVVREAFAKADRDANGSIDDMEMSNVLRNFGIHVSHHVQEELIHQVDADGNGLLSEEEFEQFFGLLQSSNGLSKHERKVLGALFDRFAAQDEGTSTISTVALVGALGWLGYSLTTAEVDAVIAEVGVNGKGMIDQREFLIFVRKVHEWERGMVEKLFEEHNIDKDASLKSRELHRVLGALGHLPDSDTIQQVIEDANISTRGSLDIDEALEFLRVYRLREGMTRAEVAEVEKAFKRYDVFDEGKLSSTDVGKVLRWFGYSTAYEMQQHLVDLVDIDKSGWIDLAEMKKLVRMYGEDELSRMRALFHEKDTGGTGIISLQEAHRGIKGLHLLGADEEPLLKGEEAAVAAEAGGLDLAAFLRIGAAHNKHARDTFRQNGGYSLVEIQGLRKMFERYDVDHSGAISYKELSKLVKLMFPVLVDGGIRPKLNVLLKEVDNNLASSLDFQDFVKIFRQFSDLKRAEQVTKELRAVEATGFSPREVQEFRELFMASDTFQEQELTLSRIRTMVRSVRQLDDGLCDVLASAFREARAARPVASERSKAEARVEADNPGMLDFPEFLLFMRKLVDINFLNVQETRRISSLEVLPPGGVAMPGAQQQ